MEYPLSKTTKIIKSQMIDDYDKRGIKMIVIGSFI